ncbi:hypothetical protein TNCV_519211 [Trichonephila clavipes]|nr:hypothetical protein TNCV_519211 [Trichonephila clavipes]
MWWKLIICVTKCTRPCEKKKKCRGYQVLAVAGGNNLEPLDGMLSSSPAPAKTRLVDGLMPFISIMVQKTQCRGVVS